MRGRFFAIFLFLIACGAPLQRTTPVAPSTLSTSTSTTATSLPTTTGPPTTTAAPSTTTMTERGTLVIHGVGDVNLDTSYIPALAERGFDWAWSGLDGLFLDDDLTVVNLECSPSPLGSPESKEFTFRCPDGFTEMAAAGVEVANLANNHSQDFGKEALIDGRLRLLEAGIDTVGAGGNVRQANGFFPYLIRGWKVAVVGFGGIQPHAGWLATEDRAGMSDGDDIESMTAAVARAEAWADWVVVTVHWGVELDLAPRLDDIERAEAMIAAGADVIFGHHPHRLQPLEVIAGTPVAWSLGNFVWPNFSPAGSETAVARIVISPTGEIQSCLITAYIEGPGHPVLTGEPNCVDT
ncbi:MAG: CapA family protein [Acidimicrobiia bacterium]